MLGSWVLRDGGDAQLVDAAVPQEGLTGGRHRIEPHMRRVFQPHPMLLPATSTSTPHPITTPRTRHVTRIQSIRESSCRRHSTLGRTVPSNVVAAAVCWRADT